MKKLLLYFLLLQALGIHAQKGYLAGDVITNAGDTNKGLIKDRKYISGVSSWQKIKFIDAAGNQLVYDPEEIKEYRRVGKPKYVTLVIGVEVKKTFVEMSEDGPVILYTYYRGTWGSAGNGITIGARGNESKQKTDFYATVPGLPVYSENDRGSKAECFLQFRNRPASLMQWRPRDYKTTAKVFFGDNQEIMNLINADILTENDIFAIVKKYNMIKAGQ